MSVITKLRVIMGQVTDAAAGTAVACKVNRAGSRGVILYSAGECVAFAEKRRGITIRVDVMVGRSKREGTLGTYLVRPLLCSLVIYKKLQTYPQHAQWIQVQASC
jgi:hypothetical protein